MAKKRTSGGRRLMESKKKPILLGVTLEQWQMIKQAAEIEMRPVTQFVLFHALNAARKEKRHAE
jgi:uncharacterized protein (DUF1778 family)